MKNPKTISTTDFYADYAAHLQNATDLAASSVSGYLSDLRFFMAWFTESNGEAFRPAAVTPTDVKQFRTYMQAVRGHKAATINQRLAGLTRFMDWASRAGHVSPNPVAKIEYLKLEPAAPRHLDRKQRLALERQLQKNRQVAILKYPKRWRTVARDAALILFLLNTGLRVGEAVRLRFGDLRLGERSGAAVVQGKGRKQRTVALNRTARAALKEWLGVREGEERPDGYV